MILSNALEKINRYNQLCVHYNLVAHGVYKARASINDLFDTDYLSYIVAALISFDLGRTMGQGSENRYDPHARGFARNLYDKLQHIKLRIGHLTNVRLCNANLSGEKTNIIAAYDELASGGKNGLHQKGHEFHVGATKILHFINPGLFLIIDSNAARAFRASHGIGYRNYTQPEYSAEKYINCWEYAKTDLITFGVNEFCSLEKGSPLARIYDKLSSATGSGWF
jgi:hypothetical protein